MSVTLAEGFVASGHHAGIKTARRDTALLATDDGKAVTSRGWYRIDPGKCLHPDVTGQPKQVFSFAEAVDADNRAIKLKDKPLNWGGPKELCTRESKFEISEQGDCGTRGLAPIGFAPVDMSSGGKTLPRWLRHPGASPSLHGA